MGAFVEQMKRHEVEFDQAALEAPQQIGKAERQGGLWKEIFHRVVADCHVEGEADVEVTSVIVNQTRNGLHREHGFRRTNGSLELNVFDHQVLFYQMMKLNDSKSSQPPTTRPVPWRGPSHAVKRRELRT